MEALGVRAACAACVALFDVMVEGSRRSRARQRTLCSTALPHQVLAPAFRLHRYRGSIADRPDQRSRNLFGIHARHLKVPCPFSKLRCLLAAIWHRPPPVARAACAQQIAANVLGSRRLTHHIEHEACGLRRQADTADHRQPDRTHILGSGGLERRGIATTTFSHFCPFFSSEIRLTFLHGRRIPPLWREK